MLSTEFVHRVLDYSPATGEFRWKSRASKESRVEVGGLVCSKTRGYLRVKLLRHTFFLHRLAWFYVHGVWPTGLIDHINGVKSDNRLVNLRDASRGVNMQNEKKARTHNKTGLLGVCQEGSKFVAKIRPPGRRQIRLGMFGSPEEAHSVYLIAKRLLHEGNTL